MFRSKDMHERSASNIGSNWEGSKRRESRDPRDRMIVMRRAALLLAIVVLMRAAHATAPQPPSPVVLELFTSEGCSSCPPADALLLRLLAQPVDGVHTIVLGEHVDYWDRLGWKDRFSSPAFTRRQQVYANRFNLDSAYTPQIVVDGRIELIGSDGAALRKAIERAHREAHGALGVVVRARGANALDVAVEVRDLSPLGRGERADIVVAVTEEGLQSNVTSGENRGRVLAHAAVVRHLATIGEATAEPRAVVHGEIPLAADWHRDRLRVVAFVQERRGRAILASAFVRGVQDER
jgi:hypothetical protein